MSERKEPPPPHPFTRREILRKAGTSILTAPLFLPSVSGLFTNAYGERIQSESLRGRVIVSRDSSLRAFGEGDLDGALSRGIQALMMTDTPAEAWKRLFRPSDVVGIKVNSLGGKRLSPSPALVEALVKGLSQAGIRPSSVVVFDRSSRELQQAGFPVRTEGQGYRCFGTDSVEGGYDSELSMLGPVGSFFSRILTRHVSVLVNLSVLKDHDLSGVSACLKNFYGLIHNPNRYHQNNCSPYLAWVATHADLRKKCRLHVLEAPMGQYHGGPAFSPDHLWPVQALVLSMDPVATDRLVWDMVDRARREKGLRSLAEEHRLPAWIAEAGRMGLGEANLESVKVREVRP